MADYQWRLSSPLETDELPWSQPALILDEEVRMQYVRKSLTTVDQSTVLISADWKVCFSTETHYKAEWARARINEFDLLWTIIKKTCFQAVALSSGCKWRGLVCWIWVGYESGPVQKIIHTMRDMWIPRYVPARIKLSNIESIFLANMFAQSVKDSALSICWMKQVKWRDWKSYHWQDLSLSTVECIYAFICLWCQSIDRFGAFK